jgi:hypothetical protein
MRFLKSAALAIILSLAVSSCAPVEGTGDRSSANVITAEEIAASDARNLYELVERLRPRWLVARGGSRSFGNETGVLVYQGQTRLGGAEVLRQFRPDSARRLEYLDGTTAAATLPGIGSGHVAGAIVIHSR